MSRKTTATAKNLLLSPTRIRSHREKYGLNQTVAADRAIITGSVFSAIENGRRIANIAQIVRIGLAFELSVDEKEELIRLAVHDQIVNTVLAQYGESAAQVVSLGLQAKNLLDEHELANLTSTMQRVIDAKNLLLNPRFSM